MNTRLSTLLAITLTFSLQPGATRAAEFYPISAVEVNMTSGNPGGNPLTNVIEGAGVGFAADPPHNATGGVWYTDDPGGFPSDYISVHEGPEYLWFDLGSDVELYEISFWGYSSGNSNGMREFNLSFATEAEGGDAGVLGDEMYGASITDNPAFEAIQDPMPRQSFGFSPVTARYVRVEATSTFYEQPGAGAGGDRLGIGEFAFEDVPEEPTITAPTEFSLSDIGGDIVEFEIPVRNSGITDLTITGTMLTGANGAAFFVTGTPGPIATLTNSVISMEFDPTGLEGPVTATLQIMSNDPANPTVEVIITGTVPPSAQSIMVLAPPVDRSLAVPKTLDVEVNNEGGTSLTLNGASFTGPDAVAFSLLNIPPSVDPVGSAAIQIQIDPTGREGLLEATMRISSDDPDTPVAEVLIQAVALGDSASFFPIASVTASTEADDLYPVANLIQGPGTGFDSASPYTKLLGGAEGLWVTNACGFPCDYITVTGKPVLIFDLEQNVPLGEISVWGYSATNSNGLSEFSLRFATEAEGTAGFGNSIAYNPTFAGIDSGELPNPDDLSRFSFPFEEGAFARYVELTCEDNHFIAPGTGAGGEIPGGDRVGIGEIAFSMLAAPSGVPFQVLSIEVSGGEVALVFSSRPGLTYSIYRSPDLGITGGWEELDDSYQSGGETTTFVDDFLPAGTTRMFYQIRLGGG